MSLTGATSQLDVSCRVPEVIVIADDLTGACDSAISFAIGGRRVLVCPGPWSGNGSDAAVWSFSTETRNASPQQARAVVAELLRQLQPDMAESTVFMKVDSAGRGNPAAEITQALETAQCDLAIYAPAFPATGRTVIDGVLRIQDHCGQDTQLPLHTIFSEPTVVLPALQEAGMQPILKTIRERKERIWIADATSQQDLHHLVKAVSTLRKRVLWAGSAGLAQALAMELCLQPEKTSVVVPELEEAPAAGMVVVIAGTPHPVTTSQVAQLAKHWPACEFSKNDTLLQFAKHSCALVRLSPEQADDVTVRETWRMLWHQEQPAALVLTGGDTASLVLRALHAESLELCGEVMAGIPWGKVHGGLADGLRFITKSGGFGGEMALVECVKFLRGGRA